MHRRILTCFSSRKLVPSPKIPLSFFSCYFILWFHGNLAKLFYLTRQTAYRTESKGSGEGWTQNIWWWIWISMSTLGGFLTQNTGNLRLFMFHVIFVIPKFLPFISVWWVVHDCMSLTCHSESSACCCFWVSIFKQHQDVPPAEQWSFHLGAGVCSSKDINNGNKCVGNRVIVNWKEDWV